MQKNIGMIPSPMQLASASPQMMQMMWQSIQYYTQHPNLGFGLLSTIRYLVAEEYDYAFCINFNKNFLKKKLAAANVSRIQIERPTRAAVITIHTARPGVVIGKKGADIEALRKDVSKILGLHINNVKINIEEIRKPELDAQLVAESIAQQLERRVMFRRAMKRSMQNTMPAVTLDSN